jgi:hypothetical protein
MNTNALEFFALDHGDLAFNSALAAKGTGASSPR